MGITKAKQVIELIESLDGPFFMARKIASLLSASAKKDPLDIGKAVIDFARSNNLDRDAMIKNVKLALTSQSVSDEVKRMVYPKLKFWYSSYSV